MPRTRADAPPVDAFVAMEVGKAKALLRTVDESLGAIGRLVRGTELLGATTKAEGNALLKVGPTPTPDPDPNPNPNPSPIPIPSP